MVSNMDHVNSNVFVLPEKTCWQRADTTKSRTEGVVDVNHATVLHSLRVVNIYLPNETNRCKILKWVTGP